MDLLRIARLKDGQVVADFNSQPKGRGAYVCPIGDCLTTAFKRLRLAKSLRLSNLSRSVEAEVFRALTQKTIWLTGDLQRLWQ